MKGEPSFLTFARIREIADSKVKPLSTGICFAAQLDGRGRLLENVMGEVGCLGLDYDHLSSETMGILFELIRHSPHVLIAYRTISGNGLRIIVGYQRPEGCELSFSWNCTRQCCRRRWRCSTPFWASRPTGSAWTFYGCRDSPTTNRPSSTGMPNR